MTKILLDLIARVIMILLFLFYPVIAIVALPWALIDSAGSWGHTSYRSWLDGWAMFSLRSLRDAFKALIAPLGSNL